MYEHAHIPLSATTSASEPVSEPVSTAADLYKQYAQDTQAEGRSPAATHVKPAPAPVSLTLGTCWFTPHYSATQAPVVQAAVPAQCNAVLEVPKVQKAAAEPAAKGTHAALSASRILLLTCFYASAFDTRAPNRAQPERNKKIQSIRQSVSPPSPLAYM